MKCFNDDNAIISAEKSNPFWRGCWKGSIALVLVFALTVCSLPAPAQVVYTCPGSGTGAIDCALLNAEGSTTNNSAKASSGPNTVAIAAAAGGAAAVGLLIFYLVKRKRNSKAEQEAQSASAQPSFKAAARALQSKQCVSSTKMSSDRPASLTPGEKFDISLPLLANSAAEPACGWFWQPATQ